MVRTEFIVTVSVRKMALVVRTEFVVTVNVGKMALVVKSLKS